MRSLLFYTFTDARGNVEASKALTFYERNGTTPLALPIYKTPTGSETYTTPELVTNSRGEFTGWTKKPRRVQIAVAGRSSKVVTAFSGDDSDDTMRVTDAGAVADCVQYLAAGSSTRNSTTVTVIGASLTSADEGKVLMLRDPSAPMTSSTADISSGDATLTVDTPAFTSSMVGMTIQVEGAGAAGATLTTTIQSFNSSTSVELATNASTTVSDNIAAWFHQTYSSTISEVTSATTCVMNAAPSTTMASVDVTIGTDNTDMIQAALDDLPEDGGILEFPGGPSAVYGYTGGVTLPSNVVLRGRATLRRMDGLGATLFATEATPEDITIVGLKFDQQHQTTGKLLVVENGSSRITMEHCRAYNNAPVTTFVYFKEGAAGHDTVTLRRNRFERTLVAQTYLGTASPENTSNVVISDADVVRVESNYFQMAGALYVQGITNSATHRDWVISGNRFLDCPATNMFVGWSSGVASAVVDQVEISRNRFLGGGRYVEKGAIEVGFGDGTCTMRNLTIDGNNVRGMGYEGSSGGLATANKPSMIRVGNGAFIDGVAITGNAIDGATTAGANPDGHNFGITVDWGVTRYAVTGNSIQRLGAAGIHIMTLAQLSSINATIAANPPSHGSITGNTVSHTCLETNSGLPEGGITVWYAKHLTISGNTCFRNGNNDNANNYSAGIVVNDGDAANSAISTLIAITGNTCTDIATAVQDYGIRVGQVGAGTTNGPTYVTVSDNVCSGNATLNVFHASGTNKNYSLYSNLGAEAGNNEATLYREITATTTWNPGDLADGAQTGTTVTCTGAATGDVAMASHSSIDTGGVILHANVTSANTVTVTLFNESGGNYNLADGTLRVVVRKY